MSLITNTTSLQSILDAINALPEAGSGGGSIETCIVMITGDVFRINGIAYMILDNDGNPSARYITDIVSNLTLTDIICNSVMAISYNYNYNITVAAYLTNGTSLEQYPGFYSIVSIDAQSGETTVVNIISGGGSGAN